MAQRGHEVTVVSAFPLKEKVENHRDIKVSIPDSFQVGAKALSETKYLMGIFGMCYFLYKPMIEMGVEATKSEDFQNLLNEEFDLILIGATTNNFLLGYGDHFKCPTAFLNIQKNSYFSNALSGNPLEVHSAPSFDAGKAQLTFGWRLKNFLLTLIEIALIEYLQICQEKAYNEIFPKEKFRSYDESLKNVSLFLINDHFSFGNVRPLVPNLIDIRGIQVDAQRNEIPKDLKNFLNNASKGAILMSLGSNVKSNHLSYETIEILLKTFAKLKQDVVLKWDQEPPAGAPKNIFFSSWLPQNEILAHPKLKLFISHCGLGGTMEAKFHGVPILALPFYGDQILNAEQLVKEGIALKLDINRLTEESFYDAITTMIYNQTFFNTARKMSNIYHDRPMSPKETAIYWLEYVIRHRGAPHMNYPAIHLNFFQRNSLDVIGFLFLSFYCIFRVFEFLVKSILGKLPRSKLKKN